MQKLAKRLSAVMVALFTVFSALTVVPVTSVAASAAVKPVATIAQQPNATYTQGDLLQMKLQAPNYTGRVEYKVVIENLTTKAVTNLFGSANLGYYTKTQPSGLYAFPIHWAFNQAGTYRVFVYVRPANTRVSMSSYAVSSNFTVAPKVNAEDKVAAYEKAALVTVDDITKADALKAEAVAEVAKVEDATQKAAFEARIAAQDKLVDAARYVHVKSVAGVNVNTINVVFNKEVAAQASNFKIYPKDNPYYSLVVEKVSVSKDTASISVYDTLSKDTTYVVEATGVTSADTKFNMKEKESQEFTFAYATPASIALVSNKVAASTATTSSYLQYVIKDANGNDITANYTLGNEVTVETSNSAVINDATLKAITLNTGDPSQYAIVNVKLTVNSTTISTGNQIVEVYAANSAKLTSLGRFTLATGTYDKPVTSLFKSASPVAFNVETLDQNGKAFTATGVDYSYISSNPTVAVVDASTKLLDPLSVGSTNITVVATVMSGTTVVSRVSNVYAVTVKADAKATAITVDKTAVNVVNGSGIAEKVHVKVLDQYGNPVDVSPLTVAVDKAAVVQSGFPTSLTLTKGEADLTIYAGTDTGTAKVTLKYAGLTDVNVIVNSVAPAAFAGYIVSADKTTLDLMNSTLANYDDLSKGPNNTLIHVYAKDINGNKIDELTTTEFAVSTLQTDATKVVLDSTTTNGTITAKKVGSETVAVKVGTATVGVVTFNVVDSTPVISTVTQLQSSLSVSAGDLTSALFGVYDTTNSKYTTKGVFVGYDQYGNEVPVAASVQSIHTTDGSVVGVVGTTATALKAGKVTLVVQVLDKYYTLEVLVK